MPARRPDGQAHAPYLLRGGLLQPQRAVPARLRRAPRPQGQGRRRLPDEGGGGLPPGAVLR
eukprot:1984277-Alexandrium_andersonii.AAC.1